MSSGRDAALLLVYLGPPASGGTVQALARLARLWSESGYQVEIATYRDPGVLDTVGLPMVRVGPAPASRVSGVPLRAALRRAPDVMRYAAFIRRAMRERPDAVVLPFLTGTALLTLAAAIGLPNRVVACERIDVVAQSLPWHFRLLQRLLYPRAAAFTINSSNPAASHRLRSISRGRSVHVVPNPLPRDIPAADPANSRVILAVGRLADQKRHATLLEAFAAVADRIPEWRVVIVGDGPLRRDLEAQIDRLDLTERVTLTGQVDDPRPYYASAGLFVLPSAYEGTSNALLEAASAGLPCIVSAEAAPPETTDHLIKVPSDSPHALAMRILEVCTAHDTRTDLALRATGWLGRWTDDEVLSGWTSAIRPSNTPETPGR